MAGLSLSGLSLSGLAPGPVSPVGRAEAQTLPGLGLSTYGTPGLIDMPSATAMPDGTLSSTIFAMRPSARATLSFQATPRLTLSFRYARVQEPDYRLRTGNALHDRSFDLHYLLLQEGRYAPSVAIGLRDFIGTGLFSSEYIVASRAVTPRLRVSAGLGWGRMATRDNPLRDTGRFRGEGGLIEFGRFFRGRPAPFAGVEYQATDRLTLMAEYSSDMYQLESTRAVRDSDPPVVVEPSFRPRTPLNLGFRYQASPATTLAGYIMHGTTIGFSATFALNPAQPAHGGVQVTAPSPILRRPTPPAGGEFSTSWAANAVGQGPRLRAALAPALAQEGVRLEGIELEPRRAVLRVTNQRHEVLPRAIGRTARVMTRALPHSVEEIVIIPMHGGVAGTAVTLRRSDLERHEFDPDGAARILAGARFSDPLGFPGVGRVWQPLPEGRNRFEWAIGPYVQTSFFDPSQPIRGDVGVQAIARLNAAENLSFNLTLRQRVFGNIDQGTLSPPTITDPRFTPRVRTGAFRYSSDRLTVERMTMDYTLRPGPDLYGRLTLGWLERMYAGASAELLWSPADSRLALGAEVNYVAQRSPHSFLGVNDLRIATGHVSAYYDFGGGFMGQIDAGRYLAGDVGASLRLERAFANGLRVGAYATLTNMPFDQFGEGSFDKGITLTIPLTSLLGRPTTAMPSNVLQSLNRDGGAMLRVPGRLYPTIQDSRARALRSGWGAVLQ